MGWQIVRLDPNKGRCVALRHIVPLLRDNVTDARLDYLFQNLVRRVLRANQVDQSSDGLHGKFVDLVVLRPN